MIEVGIGIQKWARPALGEPTRTPREQGRALAVSGDRIGFAGGRTISSQA